MSRLEKRPHNRKYSFFVLFYFMTNHVLVNTNGLFSLFVSMSTWGVYLKFCLRAHGGCTRILCPLHGLVHNSWCPWWWIFFPGLVDKGPFATKQDAQTYHDGSKCLLDLCSLVALNNFEGWLQCWGVDISDWRMLFSTHSTRLRLSWLAPCHNQ